MLSGYADLWCSSVVGGSSAPFGTYQCWRVVYGRLSYAVSEGRVLKGCQREKESSISTCSCSITEAFAEAFKTFRIVALGGEYTGEHYPQFTRAPVAGAHDRTQILLSPKKSQSVARPGHSSECQRRHDLFALV